MFKKLLISSALLGTFVFSYNVFATTWTLNVYEPDCTSQAIWAQTSAPDKSPIEFTGIDYNHCDGKDYNTYDLTMWITGKQMTAKRTNDSSGVNCTYTGIINGTKADGDVVCDHGFPTMAWDATIYVNKTKK